MSLERYTITLINDDNPDTLRSKEVWYEDDFSAVREALRVFCGVRKHPVPGEPEWHRWSLMRFSRNRLPRIVAAGKSGDTLDRYERLQTHASG